jgi:hypothetical protein
MNQKTPQKKQAKKTATPHGASNSRLVGKPHSLSRQRRIFPDQMTESQMYKGENEWK